MGLFSRNESASDSGRRSTSRTSLSSEAQANELRGRARRRLIGALALVLAAVIVVPMLFDSSVPEDEISRSEEHTSELQSLMRISYAVFCLTKKRIKYNNTS